MYERHSYPPGSVVQRSNGYVFVKTDRGWTAQHRLIASNVLEKRELVKNERVYHKNGDREDNDPKNLVVLRFSEHRFKHLPHPRIIYIPK